MKYFIIAGERSGDQHASQLVAELIKSVPKSSFAGWGGDNLSAVGVKILRNYEDFSVMGFWEVFKQLFRLKALLEECKRDLLEYKPDRLILVDFSGFNLRIAKFAYEQNIPVYYYIPPKAWAWNESRAKKLAKYCKTVLCILPFEENYFQKAGVNAYYVGNPTLENLEQIQFKDSGDDCIGFFPGSRIQEIRKTIPILLDLAGKSNFKFRVAAISALSPELYDTGNLSNIELVFDQPNNVLRNSGCAVITSGTASLEASLMAIPHVVIYRTNALSYWIGRLLIKVRYISLVNLVLDRHVVTELVQDRANADQILNELTSLINDEERRRKMGRDFDELRKVLGKKKASIEAAKIISAS